MSQGLFRDRQRIALIAVGLALELWATQALLQPPGEDVPRYVALFVGIWTGYVLAVRMVLSLPPNHLTLDLVFIFMVSVAVRGTLLLSSPSLSDDVFRAIWDARVFQAGGNPYAFPPGAPELQSYRDAEYWPRVNAQDQRTPYPPASELLGAAAYALLPERPIAFQGLSAALDVVTAGLLAWLLSRFSLDPRRALVVAWNPVGVLHFAHSGHNDSAMVAAMVGAGLLLSLERKPLAMASLAIATMVKAAPVLAVPAFARRTGPLGALTWLTTCALIAAPFASVGPIALTGLLEEGGHARFNDSLHWLLDRVALAFFGAGGNAVSGGVTVVLVVAAAAILAQKVDSPPSAFVAGSRALGVYLLCAPVVQPWHTTWLAPLTALRIERGRPGPFAVNDSLAWLWLGGASVLTELSYWPSFEGAWPVIRAVEYLPLYAILGWTLWSTWRRGEMIRAAAG